jgi:hypothetical protein
MNDMHQHVRALGLSLLLLAGACSDDSPCGVPGVVQTCACSGGMHGARVCGDDKTWQACNCSGAIALPNPVADKPTMHGSGGSGSGGRGGMMPPKGGSGGMMAPPTSMDEDGGGGVADGGGSGGSGSGGMNAHPDAGGTGGAMADAGMPTPMNAYGACKTPADCVMGAQCIVTASTPTDATVCAPPCVDTGDCPVPPGSYQAVLTCVTGYCQLDCTPVLFDPLLSCPSGMTCIAPLFGESYCHANP